MEINKELKHIAEYQNSILPRHQKRTEEAIEIIANDAIESLKNGTFDFKSFLHLDLNQNGKHRQVIMYKPFSPEELLCIFLKRVPVSIDIPINRCAKSGSVNTLISVLQFQRPFFRV